MIKEQIRAIIKQYADKGARLFLEASQSNENYGEPYWDGYKDCANGLLRELKDMQEVQEPRYSSFEKLQGEWHPFQDIALTDKDMKKELIKNMVSLIVGEALLEFIEKPTSPKIVNDLREKYSEKILSAIDSMQEEPTTSVWHDASEKVEKGKLYLYRTNQNIVDINRSEGKEFPDYCERWAYIDDLIKL